MNPRSLLAAIVLTFLAVWSPRTAQAESFAVPDLPARDGVEEVVATRFVTALRDALRDLGHAVSPASLVTPGIAGSLEPEFAVLIAQLEGTRYGVSGEVVARAAVDGPFAVDLLAADVLEGRATDLTSRAFGLATLEAAAAEVAATLAAFAAQEATLPEGDAGLFVSTVPRGAEVRVNGIAVGRSGALDLLGLAPGRYEVEVRLEGHLPEVRTLDLRGGDTRFLHVELTEIVGGSLQVVSRPVATVIVDGEVAGRSPLTLTAQPGDRVVEVRRPGFLPRVQTVPVRGFRVTRVDVDLEPVADPLVTWWTDRSVRVFVDGVQQPAGYAAVQPGLRTFEVLIGGEVRRWLKAVPVEGTFELDLEDGALRPLAP